MYPIHMHLCKNYEHLARVYLFTQRWQALCLIVFVDQIKCILISDTYTHNLLQCCSYCFLWHYISPVTGEIQRFLLALIQWRGIPRQDDRYSRALRKLLREISTFRWSALLPSLKLLFLRLFQACLFSGRIYFYISFCRIYFRETC